MVLFLQIVGNVEQQSEEEKFWIPNQMIPTEWNIVSKGKSQHWGLQSSWFQAMHSSSQAIVQKCMSQFLYPFHLDPSECLGSTHTLQTFSCIVVWLLHINILSLQMLPRNSQDLLYTSLYWATDLSSKKEMTCSATCKSPGLLKSVAKMLTLSMMKMTCLQKNEKLGMKKSYLLL